MSGEEIGIILAKLEIIEGQIVEVRSDIRELSNLKEEVAVQKIRVEGLCDRLTEMKADNKDKGKQTPAIVALVISGLAMLVNFFFSLLGRKP